jgi:hypothetical protein
MRIHLNSEQALDSYHILLFLSSIFFELFLDLKEGLIKLSDNQENTDYKPTFAFRIARLMMIFLVLAFLFVACLPFFPQGVHKIDLTGLPFQGSPDAPVTVAFFSDYQ